MEQGGTKHVLCAHRWCKFSTDYYFSLSLYMQFCMQRTQTEPLQGLQAWATNWSELRF